MTLWTESRLSFLRECAGEMHPAELADWLGIDPLEIERKAKELGLSVEYYERRTVYCVECGTYREFDEDGECPVCRARRQLADMQRAERALEREIELLDIPFDGDPQPPRSIPRPERERPADATASEWERVDDEYDVALQEWEVQRIKARKDRIKQRNFRMRRAIAEEKERAAE